MIQEHEEIHDGTTDEPSPEEQRKIEREEIERMNRENGVVVEAKSTATAVAERSSGSGRGLQNVTSGDISFPRISMDGQDGVFKVRGEDTELDEISIIPLFFSKSRVRFRVDSGRGADPAEVPDGVLCRSGDSFLPSEWVPEFFSTYGLQGPPSACDLCSFGQWGDNKEPPTCRLSMNFLAIRPDDPTPFVIGFHGTSTGEVRRILALLTRGGGDIWSKTLRLGVEKKEKDTRRFYTLKLIEAIPTDDETANLCERLYEEYIEGDVLGITMIIGGARSNGNGSEENLAPIT